MLRLTLLFFCAIAITVGVGGAVPSPVSAQTAAEPTAEEIAEKFEKQKTRGLSIVPVGKQAGSGLTESTSVTSPTTEAAYSAVAPEDQINIRISFDFDSAALRPDQKPRLQTMCQVMKSVDVAQFQIIGHTDSSGSDSYNQRLSLLRAKEVKRFLVDECGIAPDRLDAIGMGERAPYDPDHPRADVNRRVEFQALG